MLSTSEPKTFVLSDLSISDKYPRIMYRRRRVEEKLAIHWGQRKLLLSEIEFFTLYWDPKLIPNPICVYAGAAPGTHIDMLSKMFPAFRFELYDPNPFDMKVLGNNDKITIFTGKNGYFTDEMAQKYVGRNDIFFVSDIRTAD